MKIIITGVTGFRNRGVEALVIPTIQQLRVRYPSAEFTVLTAQPDYDGPRLLPHNSAVLFDCFRNRDTVRRARDRISKYLPKASSLYQRAASKLANADLVIASGGDVFSSDYGDMESHLHPLRIAIEGGANVVFLAHSIGPFKTEEERKRFATFAAQTTLVSLRERKSYEYCRDVLSLPQDKLEHTADVAFLLDPVSPEQTSAMRRYYSDPKRPTIAVSASQGISFFGGADTTMHLDTWERTVRFIIDRLEADVLIVPHVQDANAKNDDRRLATELLRRCGFNERVRLVGGDHTAAEFKSIISTCDLIVAERMHACIGGLSTLTPTLAVQYSVKAEGIMLDLFGEKPQERGLLVPLIDFQDPSKGLEAVEKAWHNRSQTRQQLGTVLPKIKEQAARNFEIITAKLSSK